MRKTIEWFGKNFPRVVWSTEGLAVHSGNTVPIAKYSAGSIMQHGGCLSSPETMPLHHITGTTMMDVYLDILKQHLTALQFGADWVFQQANDPKSIAKIEQRWLNESD